MGNLGVIDQCVELFVREPDAHPVSRVVLFESHLRLVANYLAFVAQSDRKELIEPDTQ